MPMREVPGSITHAVRSLLALVVVSGAAVLLTWLQHDEIIRAWAKGNSSAQEILASGGMAALRDSAIVPKFVPLALVSFVVFVVLVVVLGAFLVDGHGWSRLVLTGTSLFGVLVASLGLNHGLPAAFVIVSALFLVLCLALRVLPVAQGHQHLSARELKTRSPSLLTHCRWGRVPLALFEHLFGRGSGGGDLDPHRPRSRWRGR